jgi:hypothetical protein
MQHTVKGKSKIVKKNTLPLTSVWPVDLVVIGMATIAFPMAVPPSSMPRPVGLFTKWPQQQTPSFKLPTQLPKMPL